MLLCIKGFFHSTLIFLWVLNKRDEILLFEDPWTQNCVRKLKNIKFTEFRNKEEKKQRQWCKIMRFINGNLHCISYLLQSSSFIMVEYCASICSLKYIMKEVWLIAQSTKNNSRVEQTLPKKIERDFRCYFFFIDENQCNDFVF